MKSKSTELLDKSIAAMVSAIEIYNKPNFLYRGETFAILAINSWELLLKAKVLIQNRNKVSSLYVYTEKRNKNGQSSKRKAFKKTKSGNPITHSLDYLAKKFVETGLLEQVAYKNLEALIELRDSAVHFYNYSVLFSKRVQEVGTASLRNYVFIIKKWFGRDLTEFNFFLMPLSFVKLEEKSEILLLNGEERNFLRFVSTLEESTSESDRNSQYNVALNLDISFTKSTSIEAVKVTLSNEEGAEKIILTDEKVRERYPYDYNQLTEKCRERYTNFIANQEYHKFRKELECNQKYAFNRYLDPGNTKSSRKTLYSHAIMNEFDKAYKLKRHSS